MGLFDWLWRRRSRSTPPAAQQSTQLMEAPPIPRGDERAETPESAQKLTQLMEEMEKVHTYLRERGVEYQLGSDEIPFAVLWPTRAADARSLGELGEQLRAWAARNPGVKRILGLERLLAGSCPEVSVLLLMIPFSPTKPESCVESVALVVVESGADTEGLAASLCDLVKRSGVAMVESWEQYSYMNR
ncbi:MAG: hypothetical protein L0Z62_17025 [Gemmataceae bacterium]|nr:hypothetical protein [Gemmataceae bacterium]